MIVWDYYAINKEFKNKTKNLKFHFLIIFYYVIFFYCTYLIIFTMLSHVARLTFFSFIFITKSPGNKPACSAIESFNKKKKKKDKIKISNDSLIFFFIASIFILKQSNIKFKKKRTFIDFGYLTWTITN